MSDDVRAEAGSGMDHEGARVPLANQQQEPEPSRDATIALALASIHRRPSWFGDPAWAEVRGGAQHAEAIEAVVAALRVAEQRVAEPADELKHLRSLALAVVRSAYAGPHYCGVDANKMVALREYFEEKA